MKIEFNDVFDAFKNLDENEKKQVIIEFLKNNIMALKELNNGIGNIVNNKDIDNITNVSAKDRLDIIYELLHLMTEQIETFSEKISVEFFE